MRQETLYPLLDWHGLPFPPNSLQSLYHFPRRFTARCALSYISGVHVYMVMMVRQN